MAQVKLNGPLYPEVVVKLTGRDGNAFSILGIVVRAMRDASVPECEIKAFCHQAKAGDYDHLLATCWKWVAVE